MYLSLLSHLWFSCVFFLSQPGLDFDVYSEDAWVTSSANFNPYQCSIESLEVNVHVWFDAYCYSKTCQSPHFSSLLFLLLFLLSLVAFSEFSLHHCYPSWSACSQEKQVWDKSAIFLFFLFFSSSSTSHSFPALSPHRYQEEYQWRGACAAASHCLLVLHH